MPYTNYSQKQLYDAKRRLLPEESSRRKIRNLALGIAYKLRAILYKGGKCQKCGYAECYTALEFHHRDPKQKEFNWPKIKNKAWSTIVAELDKCDLLCANCHRELHFQAAPLQRAIDYLRTRNDKYMGSNKMVNYTDVIDYSIKFLTIISFVSSCFVL